MRRVSPLLFRAAFSLAPYPSLAGRPIWFCSILACTHRVSPFHPRPARPQPCGIIALTRRGLVSVPEPELSPHILWDVCVSRGGRTFHTGQNWPAAAALPLSSNLFVTPAAYNLFAIPTKFRRKFSSSATLLICLHGKGPLPKAPDRGKSLSFGGEQSFQDGPRSERLLLQAGKGRGLPSPFSLQAFADK